MAWRQYIVGAAIAVWPVAAYAVTDEIQVYQGDISAVGVLNLTWHNNYTPSGLKTPAFPGAVIDNHTLSGVTEWAYGLTDWWEQGLYLPLYADSSKLGWTYNGFKLRELFVLPHNEDREFFLAINFEFSWNEKQWEDRSNTGEIRPIIGWRFAPGFSITVNPIVDNSYIGLSRLEFVPAERLDYKVNETWTVAAEEYDDFGQLRQFLPADQQWHQLWGVVDYNGDPISIETGVGFGLTPGTDRFAIKLMIITDLNGPHALFGPR